MFAENEVFRKCQRMFDPYRGLSKEIWVLFFARVVNCTGAFIFPLLTLILTKKLGVSKTDAGLIISGSGFLYGFSSMIGGKLTDRFGRKKLLLIFNSIGAILYFAAAFIGPSEAVIPLIIVAASAMGMADPASSALIADITEPKTRDGAYSLFYMGMNIGFAVSPIIGGILLENHLSLLFVLDASTAIIALILIQLFIPETIHRTKEISGEDRKLEHAVEGSTLQVLLQRPILILFALVMFGYNFVYAQWSFMYPMHVEHNFVNEGAKIYGRLVSFNALIVVTMTPLITKLLSKKENIRKIFYGGLLYAVGFGIPAIGGTINWFILSCFIITIGEITVTTSSSPFIVNHTPASHRGRITSILPIIMGLGQTLSPGIMGVVLRYLDIDKAWIIIAAVMFIFAAFTILLERFDKSKLEKDMEEDTEVAEVSTI